MFDTPGRITTSGDRWITRPASATSAWCKRVSGLDDLNLKQEGANALTGRFIRFEARTTLNPWDGYLVAVGTAGGDYNYVMLCISQEGRLRALTRDDLMLGVSMVDENFPPVVIPMAVESVVTVPETTIRALALRSAPYAFALYMYLYLHGVIPPSAIPDEQQTGEIVIPKRWRDSGFTSGVSPARPPPPPEAVIPIARPVGRRIIRDMFPPEPPPPGTKIPVPPYRKPRGGPSAR